MSFKHKIVSPSHCDFVQLANELNKSLKQITKDTGESSYSPNDFDPIKEACIVVYDNSQAVCCGAFRIHSHNTCEIKRMYSKVRGGGSYLLSKLEAHAAELDYQRAILSTRRVNTKAINFYRKHGYQDAKPYGKYIDSNKSICLEKTLIKF